MTVGTFSEARLGVCIVWALLIFLLGVLVL